MSSTCVLRPLTYLLMPLIKIGGKAAVVIAGGAIGAFGISGAVVAKLMTLNKMFGSLVSHYGVSMIVWSVALIVATRVTNFIIPGSNMVAIAQTGLLIVYALLFA